MPTTLSWRDAGTLTARLLLSVLPLFLGSINTYAEQTTEAMTINPETSSEYNKAVKTPNLWFTTVQLADTVTQDAIRSGEPGSKLRMDDAKASEESVVRLKEVVVVGKERGTSLIGETQSASQGFIGQA